MTFDVRKTEKLLRDIIVSWQPEAVVGEISSITPDASLRRYYRVSLQGVSPDSVVAMVFDSVVCPEAEGEKAVPSDRAVVELTGFFKQASVMVPALYLDAREKGVLLIEDLGSRHLIDVLAGGADDDVENLYKEALDQIVRIQKIPRCETLFAFKREFSAETYFKELLEFTDFALSPPQRGSEVSKVLKTGFRCLAEDVESFEKVLVHRDFHSWNLLVDAGGRVRVIDFQDALLGPSTYDVVGLLNDRDTDTGLGSVRYNRLLEYFRSALGRSEGFAYEYERVLLQRDLKVAGRFSKLAQVRSLGHYLQWVPGTLRRIGRTLRRICEAERVDPNYRAIRGILLEQFEEVREGNEDFSFE